MGDVSVQLSYRNLLGSHLRHVFSRRWSNAALHGLTADRILLQTLSGVGCVAGDAVTVRLGEALTLQGHLVVLHHSCQQLGSVLNIIAFF